jgi:ABC-type nitrate/sulfonate/bicarbonate transport system ATPase subunit
MDRAMRLWLTSWISDASARDATIVIATHDVAPFVPLARRAIAVAQGEARVVYPLPDEHDARITLLDRSAHGTLP